MLLNSLVMMFEKVTYKLDVDKAHCHAKISTLLIEICGKPISKPLELIFCQCINTGSFPLEWK